MPHSGHGCRGFDEKKQQEFILFTPIGSRFGEKSRWNTDVSIQGRDASNKKGSAAALPFLVMSPENRCSISLNFHAVFDCVSRRFSPLPTPKNAPGAGCLFEQT